MAIISSEIAEDRAQIDGRRSIREVHTDDLGEQHVVTYLAEAGADVTLILPERAAQIDASLVEAEHQSNLSSTSDADGGGTTFKRTTLAQFLTRLRAVYATATGLKAVLIGRFFHSLNLTDDQLKTLFGINQGQVSGLRDRFLRQSNLVDSVLAETGQ